MPKLDRLHRTMNKTNIQLNKYTKWGQFGQLFKADKEGVEAETLASSRDKREDFNK